MYIVTKQSMVKPAIKSFFENYKKYQGRSSPFYNESRFEEMSKLDPEKGTMNAQNVEKTVKQLFILDKM
jgi:hypothetical protein